MKTKNIIILLAIAGVVYFFYNKQKKKENTDTVSDSGNIGDLPTGLVAGNPVPYQEPRPQVAPTVIRPALGLTIGTPTNLSNVRSVVRVPVRTLDLSRQ